MGLYNEISGYNLSYDQIEAIINKIENTINKCEKPTNEDGSFKGVRIYSDTLTDDLSDNIATNLVNSLFNEDFLPLKKTYDKLNLVVAIYSIEDITKYRDFKNQVSKVKYDILKENKNAQNAINIADGIKTRNKDIVNKLSEIESRREEIQKSLEDIHSILQANGYTEEDFLEK